MLGVGAGAGMVAAASPHTELLAAAWQAGASNANKVTFPKGAIIRTILKDVPPEALAGGATLFHEHLSISDPPAPWLPPPKEPVPPNYTSNVDLMVEEAKATAKEGVTCIVDGGSKGLGRNVEHLRTIANRSGLHVVVGGGLYTQPRYPPDVATKTEDQIVEDFDHEARAERWGALGEIGTSPTMHPEEAKVLRAVSKFHLRTGLPIFTHTPHEGCKSCALEQLGIFEKQGVDPRLVCIGHLADIRDDPRAETHKAIAKRGAFLGFDTVGHQITQGDAKKVAMILAVLEAGYEDHVLLAADFASEREIKANGGAGYSSVVTVFVPKLRYAGVKEATIRKILVDNPRRFLAFVPKNGQ
jgi:phosphotriesterase-related protein